MAFDAHKNFAYSTVLTAPSPAASGTSLVVQSGDGAAFPAVSFNAVVFPAGQLPTVANAEIVRVTNITTDTFTITRTHESTSARTIVVGDQICAAITAKTITDVESLALIEQTSSATGAQNNFDLNGPSIYLRCSGAAPVFSGFTVNGSAPSAGDRVIIDCLGTTVKVVDEATSTAANQIITPSANGQIVGVNGRMELIYDGTTDRWRCAMIDPGAAITVAYAGLTFSGAGTLSWTVDSGDVTGLTYVQYGRVVHYFVNITNTSVSGSGDELRISESGVLPGGFSTPGSPISPVRISDNGTNALGACLASSSLLFVKVPAANFAAATNATNVEGFVVATVN